MKNTSSLLFPRLWSRRAKGQTFDATGSDQAYAVTANGTLTLTARGADGGRGIFGAKGGAGATVTATFPVLVGDVLTIVVGTKGRSSVGAVSGFGGAGGGGGTGVILTRAGIPTLLLVAGGGGGAGSGGVGGGALATDDGPGPSEGNGGGGFKSDGGGCNEGKAGTLAGGGAGGSNRDGIGGYGFGGGGACSGYGGGGGGGYAGGTGAREDQGGGGGTSFVQSAGIVGTGITCTDGLDGGSSGADGSVVVTSE